MFTDTSSLDASISDRTSATEKQLYGDRSSENAGHASAGQHLKVESITKTDAFQRYLIGISKYRLISREEERVLFERLLRDNDQQAAQTLVTSNLRLVVKIAMDYSSVWMQNLLDLIQEGNLGLIKAVEKFDPDKNVKFSYYAAFWIKAYIIKHLMDNWRLVKIGTTQAQRKLFFKLKSEKQKLKDDGFEPSAELISQRLGVPKKDVVEMDQRINGWDVSLDAPLTEDSDTARIEFLKTPSATMEDEISRKELEAILRQRISEFRKEMDSRELHIFNNRIYAEDPQTLSEIGKLFGISRERVRQIQKGIIAKLQDSFKQTLPDYGAYS
ncbi:MAG: RNA polymerase factor sigma-32 [Desulfobacterales bacterium]|nr:RNA polymerase factor sigma-32 [Desulfobacterales bacterium]